MSVISGARGRASPRAIAALLVAFVVAGLVFAGMFWLLGRHRVGGLDGHAFSLLGGAPGGLLARVAHPAAVIGPLLLALAGLAAIVLLVRRRAWLSVAVIVGGLPVCLYAARFAKLQEQRPRPPGELLYAGGYAFPSTDSALAVVALVMAIAVAGVLSSPRARAVVVAAGGLATVGAGLLFIALRVHYLSDVIAGWALGVVVFSGCALVAIAARATRRPGAGPVRRRRTASGRTGRPSA